MRAIGLAVVCGTPRGTAVWYALTGMMLASTTLMLLACASSLIDARFAWMSSSLIGPVLPAMSFVPARITTAFGFRSMTSRRNRTSICGVVWPLMPRST